MVASVDVTFLLEGIDTCTLAPIRTRCDLMLSLVALPSDLTTLLSLDFCKH
jgi:hypothetical protein